MLITGISLWYTGGPEGGAATALLVLGSICFVPGAYHTRIAVLAWKGVPGYSLDAIPDM
ncbi:TMEM230 [Scenedesmus sp. PABB004]|nr:TMEM230 [Scenedesmus sp. PABB004]